MRFFLDENFPRKAADLLKAGGHEVYDIRGSENEGANDTWIFDRAQEKKAVFLTTDRDFYHTIPAKYSSHCGAIIIALRQPNGPDIIRKFEAALAFLKNFDLESNAILLTDNRVYTLKK